MADVDMTDAPNTSGAVTKKERKGGDVDAKGDGKKRFEVKKVRRTRMSSKPCELTTHTDLGLDFVVERCCAMGLGHRRRQLCHLPKPHHGPLH